MPSGPAINRKRLRWLGRAVGLTSLLLGLFACSQAEPPPLTSTTAEPPAASPITSPTTLVPSSSAPTSKTPAGRTPTAARAAPTRVVDSTTSPLTAFERASIAVVQRYVIALLASPSPSSARVVRALSSSSCTQCGHDAALIDERVKTGEKLVDATGDPTWGSLTLSRRPSTGPGQVTVRVNYRQAPLTVYNRDGQVIDVSKEPEDLTLLYVVESVGGEPVVRSETRSS